MMAYRAAGIDLPRTTFQQVYSGDPVYSTADLEAGDLLFVPGSDGTATAPGHVGMYIGSGLVIEAPQTGREDRDHAIYWLLGEQYRCHAADHLSVL